MTEWSCIVGCGSVCAADGKTRGSTGNVQLRGKAAEKIFDMRGIWAVEWRKPSGLVFVVV